MKYPFQAADYDLARASTMMASKLGGGYAERPSATTLGNFPGSSGMMGFTRPNQAGLIRRQSKETPSGGSMRGAMANGERILALRTTAGLTQDALAADCQCDVKTIRGAERSKRMDVATLRRIADRLGVGFGELIADVPNDVHDLSIAAVQNFHRAFNSRDPVAVEQCFTDDGAVIVYADPRLPGSGEFRGRARVREWASACFAAYLADPVTEESREIRAVGNFVFARLKRSTVRSLDSGRATSASLMSEFECAAGAIVALRIYPESGAIERITLDFPGSANAPASGP